MDIPPIVSTTRLSRNSSDSAAEDSQAQASLVGVSMATVEEDAAEDEATSLDVLGVPSVIKHFSVSLTRKSPYWRFYRVLKVPLRKNSRFVREQEKSLRQYTCQRINTTITAVGIDGINKQNFVIQC